MRFEFWTTTGHSHVRACIEESDSRRGRREEGSGVMLTLRDDVATFNYEVSEIHNDVLGLLCMVLFYPFIGREVEFPRPVSPRLREAFQLPCFRRLTFRNVSNDVPPYPGGTHMALSFGGGVDSTAVRVMFPEAYVVQEAHLRDGALVASHSHAVVRNLPRGHLVTTNARYMSHPGGWHTWPCSTCTSLLLATDLHIGAVLTGSVLGSCFLHNGSHFFDRHAKQRYHGPSGNFWQSAFEKIGLPMISPVMGMSEFQTMRLSLPLLHVGEVVYCMEHNGQACNCCTKCFRRAVIRTFLEPDAFGRSVDWTRFDTDVVHALLTARPLYFAHIFVMAISLQPHLYPTWMRSRLANLITVPSNWLLRVYAQAFELVPLPWRALIAERVKTHVIAMHATDVDILKNWGKG